MMPEVEIFTKNGKSSEAPTSDLKKSQPFQAVTFFISNQNSTPFSLFSTP